MVGFVGVGVAGRGAPARGRAVCAKKGKGNKKRAGKGNVDKPVEDAVSDEPAFVFGSGPVVSTEGLTKKLDLTAALGEREKVQRGSGRLDEEEWLEWDKQVCGEWEETKGPIENVNALVPELLQLDFPSVAEALKLVVVIIVLFFLIAGFTYTIDGLYLSFARKFFGADFFFSFNDALSVMKWA